MKHLGRLDYAKKKKNSSGEEVNTHDGKGEGEKNGVPSRNVTPMQVM